MKLLAIAALLVVASSARAQNDAECAASFPARLAETKQAIIDWGKDHEAYVDARPLVEYFEAHCHFLSDRERAVRKLDDENAYACDAPKPKGLTAELVLRYSVEPSIGAYQEHAGENNRCLEQDRAARIGLVLSGTQDLAGVGEQLLVMCYGDERPSCVQARASIEAARAKGKQH